MSQNWNLKDSLIGGAEIQIKVSANGKLDLLSVPTGISIEDYLRILDHHHEMIKHMEMMNVSSMTCRPY